MNLRNFNKKLIAATVILCTLGCYFAYNSSNNQKFEAAKAEEIEQQKIAEEERKKQEEEIRKQKEAKEAAFNALGETKDNPWIIEVSAEKEEDAGENGFWWSGTPNSHYFLSSYSNLSTIKKIMNHPDYLLVNDKLYKYNNEEWQLKAGENGDKIQWSGWDNGGFILSATDETTPKGYIKCFGYLPV